MLHGNAQTGEKVVNGRNHRRLVPDKINKTVSAQIADRGNRHPFCCQHHCPNAAEGGKVRPQGEPILICEDIEHRHLSTDAFPAKGQIPRRQQGKKHPAFPACKKRIHFPVPLFQQMPCHEKGQHRTAGIQIPGKRLSAAPGIGNAQRPQRRCPDGQQHIVSDQSNQNIPDDLQQKQAGQKPDGPQPFLDQNLSRQLQCSVPESRSGAAHCRFCRDNRQRQSKIRHDHPAYLSLEKGSQGFPLPKQEPGQEEKQRHMKGEEPPGNRMTGEHMGYHDCQNSVALGHIRPGNPLLRSHCPPPFLSL